MAAVLRDRVEKLSCEFSIDDNYFAWQAFGRSYSDGGSGPLPPYLERAHFDAIRDRADRVEVLNRSFTEYLKSRPAAIARPLRAARRPGLDVGSAIERSVARDHPHRDGPARG